jgi:TPR repeat protein
MTLGMLYEQGIGVEKDEAEARKWYEIAQRNS